jgi:uncharacterized FlgJ-related protein
VLFCNNNCKQFCSKNEESSQMKVKVTSSSRLQKSYHSYNGDEVEAKKFVFFIYFLPLISEMKSRMDSDRNVSIFLQLKGFSNPLSMHET